MEQSKQNGPTSGRKQLAVILIMALCSLGGSYALFFAAQERHMPYGVVLPIEQVAENPQLAARKWFTPYQIDSHSTLSTGAPYHFSDTPWELKDYKSLGDDQETILNEIGWES